ncbi:2528_t:CDS:2, partial [Scutellospora calospora]
MSYSLLHAEVGLFGVGGLRFGECVKCFYRFECATLAKIVLADARVAEAVVAVHDCVQMPNWLGALARRNRGDALGTEASKILFFGSRSITLHSHRPSIAMELSNRNSLVSNTPGSAGSDDGVPLETQSSRAQYALPPTDQGFYAWNTTLPTSLLPRKAASQPSAPRQREPCTLPCHSTSGDFKDGPRHGAGLSGSASRLLLRPWLGRHFRTRWRSSLYARVLSMVLLVMRWSCLPSTSSMSDSSYCRHDHPDPGIAHSCPDEATPADFEHSHFAARGSRLLEIAILLDIADLQHNPGSGLLPPDKLPPHHRREPGSRKNTGITDRPLREPRRNVRLHRRWSSCRPLRRDFGVARASLLYGLTAAAYSTSWGGVIRELQRKHENTDANVVFGLLALGRGVGSVISGPLSETLLDESKSMHGAGISAYGSELGSYNWSSATRRR